MKKNVVICCVFILLFSSITALGTLYIQRYTIDKNMTSISNIFKIDLNFGYKEEECFFQILSNEFTFSEDDTRKFFKISFDKQYTDAFIKTLEKSDLAYSEIEQSKLPADALIMPNSPKKTSESKVYYAYSSYKVDKIYPYPVTCFGWHDYYIIIQENERNTEVFLVEYI